MHSLASGSDGAFKILVQQVVKRVRGAMPIQIFRGRSLSITCTRLISARDTCVNRVHLGKNWRSSPLVLSFVPRSQGEWGCAK